MRYDSQTPPPRNRNPGGDLPKTICFCESKRGWVVDPQGQGFVSKAFVLRFSTIGTSGVVLAYPFKIVF